MNATEPPPIPRSFWQYVTSFGPGLIIVLTWLGAGDIVDMGVAGANYGYSLMWVLVVAVLMRFRLRVADRQISALQSARRGRARRPGADSSAGVRLLLLVAAVVMVHVYESYMTLGAGEVLPQPDRRRRDLAMGHALQRASPWCWFFNRSTSGWKRSSSSSLPLLTVSLVGSAFWVGFNPIGDCCKGWSASRCPSRRASSIPTLVAVAMIGAIGGSIMNLAYPYFSRRRAGAVPPIDGCNSTTCFSPSP